jgi:hypothetical protein
MTSDPWLHAFITAHHPACPRCARSISDPFSAVCSHCHSQLVLALGACDSYSVIWGITLASLAALAGISLFFSSLILLAGISNLASISAPVRYLFLAQMIVALPSLLAMILAWICRRRFFTLSRRTQLVCCTASMLLILGNFTTFLVIAFLS